MVFGSGFPHKLDHVFSLNIMTSSSPACSRKKKTKAEDDGLIRGIKLATSAPRVNHLLFTDDSLLLLEANVQRSGDHKFNLANL
jgi:hypothetical protein